MWYNKKERGIKMNKNSILAFCASTAIVTGLVTSAIYDDRINKEVNAMTTQVEQLKREVEQQSKEYDILYERLSAARKRLEELSDDTEVLKAIAHNCNIDKFKVTAYSPYDDRNGLNSDGNPNYTATGITPKEGTIAVNPEIIPYGSTVVIVYNDGTIEVGRAEDTGGALRRKGNMQIDVFRRTYEEAMRHGVKEATVLWYKEE